MENKKRILVTGAAGFIGQAVVEALTESGHDVFALYREKELPENLQNKCIDLIRWNICEKTLPDKFFQGIDVVYHVAAYIPANYNDFQNAEKCYQTNALATLNLAISASINKVSRFIYVSTGNMYPFSQTIVTESDPVFPSAYATPYFVSKLAGEIYLSNVCQSADMVGISLRIGTPYGPGEPKNKVIPSLLAQAMNKGRLTIYHGGQPRYNFVYIEDIANLMERAITRGETGVYNVSSGENVSLGELAQTIISIFKDKKVELDIIPSSNNPPASFSPISIAKAKTTWGYSPIDIKVGLSKYLDYLRNDKTWKS